MLLALRGRVGRCAEVLARAVAAALPALAAFAYALVGAPEAIERLAAPTTAQLEAHVARVPADARAWVLLARRHMDADAFAAAASAYARALDASARVAADAQVWAEYADALGMAQGGSLAGEARAALGRALALDPMEPKALELAGSAAYEARDFGAARAYWSALLEQVPEDSPLRAPLRAAVDRAERLARFTLPAS
jgi:cytochrome c-type biogenesis protein CcmH